MKINWKGLVTPCIAIVLCAVVLFSLTAAMGAKKEANAVAEQQEIFALLVPGSTTFTAESVEGEEAIIAAAYRSESGYVGETVTDGYNGPITMWIGVDNAGMVTGLTVRDLSETAGLGGEALRNERFLAQFTYGEGDHEVGADIDAITGATVTSRVVTTCVNAAVAYATGADVVSGATEWEG